MSNNAIENNIFFENSFYVVSQCKECKDCSPFLSDECELCVCVKCDCSGCNDSIDVAHPVNIKNNHCMYCSCVNCVCENRRVKGLYQEKYTCSVDSYQVCKVCKS